MAMRAAATSPVSEPSLRIDRKSTRLNSSHHFISYAVFCLKIRRHALQEPDQAGERSRRAHARHDRVDVMVHLLSYFFFFNDPAAPGISPFSQPGAFQG